MGKSNLATTRMSSKGQVVIPEEVRIRLGLHEGSQFVVLGDKDTVILKALQEPSLDQFNDLIKKVRAQAKEAGLKRADVDDIIKKARRRK
jgi:AbrB family looped-hinge helix DNA binding protein